MLLARLVKKFAGWETLLPVSVVICRCRMCVPTGLDGPAGGECDRCATTTMRVVAAFGFRPEPTLTPPWGPLGHPASIAYAAVCRHSNQCSDALTMDAS
jgi:hypothetical protein